MGSDRPRVFWSPEAQEDLSNIFTYYLAAVGTNTAERIVDAIGAACELLCEHPLAGVPRDEMWPGLRSFVMAPHVIFYRVNDGLPQIVRILDERQDVDRQFRA